MYNNDKTLAKIKPELWKKINSMHSGLLEKEGSLYLFTTIPLAHGGDLTNMNDNYWKVLIQLKPQSIFTQSNDKLFYYFLILLVSALLSWSIVYYYHQKKLIRQMDKLSTGVFNICSQGIFITNSENKFIAVNPAFTEITGYQFNDVLDKDPSILASGKHDQHFYNNLWQQLQDKGEWAGELWNKTKAGTVFPGWVSISVIKSKQHKVQYYVSMFSDITQQKNDEAKLLYKAHYDHLTALPNRQLFLEHLRHALNDFQRSDIQSALLFIDLDKFKEVNDTLGHQAGDELLIEVSHRLLSCIRESDIAARLGGDEFTVILSNIKSKDNAIMVIKNILARLNKAFILSGKETFISASIGAVMFTQDNPEIETLLSDADQAMYQAKNSGRNGFHFFKKT